MYNLPAAQARKKLDYMPEEFFIILTGVNAKGDPAIGGLALAMTRLTTITPPARCRGSCALALSAGCRALPYRGLPTPPCRVPQSPCSTKTFPRDL